MDRKSFYQYILNHTQVTEDATEDDVLIGEVSTDLTSHGESEALLCLMELQSTDRDALYQLVRFKTSNAH